MRWKKITALLSGAAVLMTTVMGGCFFVPAAETEMDQQMVITSESTSDGTERNSERLTINSQVEKEANR